MLYFVIDVCFIFNYYYCWCCLVYLWLFLASSYFVAIGFSFRWNYFLLRLFYSNALLLWLFGVSVTVVDVAAVWYIHYCCWSFFLVCVWCFIIISFSFGIFVFIISLLAIIFVVVVWFNSCFYYTQMIYEIHLLLFSNAWFCCCSCLYCCWFLPIFYLLFCCYLVLFCCYSDVFGFPLLLFRYYLVLLSCSSVALWGNFVSLRWTHSSKELD